MESIPAEWRGRVSGLLQAGYPTGYLLASLLNYLEPVSDWRGMFMVGALPALLVLYIRRNVPESPDWTPRRPRETQGQPARRRSRSNLPLAIYAVLLMTAFNFFSHGTQDLYPSAFLGEQHGFDAGTVSTIAVIYNIGAMCGGLFFGSAVAAHRPPPRHRHRGAAVARRDAALGLRQHAGDARHRRLPDAVLRAGRLGRDPGASQRAVAGRASAAPSRASSTSSATSSPPATPPSSR